MCKCYIPWAKAKDVFEITADFYIQHGFKTILVDLDNTLDSYKTELPSETAHMWKAIMDVNNINIIITSNNTGKRVKKYADALGVKYWSSIGKPFGKKLRRKLIREGLSLKDVVMVGDQTTTDVACANHAHIKSVLTDKIVKEDQPTTRFNRLFDVPMRKIMSKKDLFVDWRKR